MHTLYSNKNEHEIYNWQKGCCSLIAFYSILKYSSMISSNFFMLIIFVLLFLLRTSLVINFQCIAKKILLKKCGNEMSEIVLWSRQKICNLREIKRKCKKNVPFPHLCHSELKIKLTIHRWCNFFSTLLSI